MTQAYSVTLNLPIELQESLPTITESYLHLLADKKHIQSYEQCKDGKLHCHIGYLSDPQKSTSNETRKFNSCYPFSKKDHPNAIKHISHDSWDTLIGYIAKDNITTKLSTNLTHELIDQCRTNYTTLIKTAKKQKYYTLNQIVEHLIDYIQKTPLNLKSYCRALKGDNMQGYIRSYLKTIKKNILYTTYAKLNLDKLIEFLRIQIDISNYYI
jgi:hypothetical protein